MHVPERVRVRIEARADRAPTGCLVSRYSVGSHGYAQIGWQVDGKVVMTTCHRALWIAVNGDPGEMTVDHRCHNRRCVDITHLRLLTNAANATDDGARLLAVETDATCRCGAPLWRRPSGRKFCRACTARLKREYRARSHV